MKNHSKLSIYVIGLVFLLQSCAYKSIIISARDNGHNIITSNSAIGSDHADPTILNESVNLETMIEQDTNRTGGDFQIYLSNEEEFIRADVSMSLDTLIFVGEILQNSKEDTMAFLIKYPLNKNKLETSKIVGNSYMAKLNLVQDSMEATEDRNLNFVLSETKNFIITPNSLELLTGEISTLSGSIYKYIILNDPTKITRCLESLCILSIVDYKKARKECERKLEHVCRKNSYYIHTEYSFPFSRVVYCDCIKK